MTVTSLAVVHVEVGGAHLDTYARVLAEQAHWLVSRSEREGIPRHEARLLYRPSTQKRLGALAVLLSGGSEQPSSEWLEAPGAPPLRIRACTVDHVSAWIRDHFRRLPVLPREGSQPTQARAPSIG